MKLTFLKITFLTLLLFLNSNALADAADEYLVKFAKPGSFTSKKYFGKNSFGEECEVTFEKRNDTIDVRVTVPKLWDQARGPNADNMTDEEFERHSASYSRGFLTEIDSSNGEFFARRSWKDGMDLMRPGRHEIIVHEGAGFVYVEVTQLIKGLFRYGVHYKSDCRF